MERADRPGLVAAAVALALGAASAAMTAFWALGGTALLDTVGGEIERWGRQRSTGVLITLWVLVAAKLVAAAAPLVLIGAWRGLPSWMRSSPARALGWVIGVGLLAYGGLLTVGGLLVQADVIAAADDADERALAWHTYFWDPWFLLWGTAFTVALWRSRGRRPR